MSGKITHGIFIFLILVLALLCAPVSATIQFYEVNYPGSGTEFNVSIHNMTVYNISNYTSINELSYNFESTAIYQQAHSSLDPNEMASTDFTATIDGVNIGQGIITFTNTTMFPNLDIVFQKLDIAGYSGTKTIEMHFDDSDLGDFTYAGAGWGGFSWSNSRPVMLSRYAGSTNYAVGSGKANYLSNYTLTYNGAYAGPEYTNITINVKSNSTGIDIPRANVDLAVNPSSSLSGQTNLYGNIEFDLVDGLYNPKVITVSKAGYNTSVTSVVINYTETTKLIQVYLDDAVPPGGLATVYLDIVDLNNNAAISGATVGIENLTADVNAWRYDTYSESTILFNATGINKEFPLAVGENVVFAGYKTGAYEANNTGTYTIPSIVSHTNLYLGQANANASNATYFYPVTIVDAVSTNAIGNSNLSAAHYSAGYSDWYNSTSSTGKFNVSGLGSNRQILIQYGDTISFRGSAYGYETNSMMLSVTDTNNGVLQVLALAPNGIKPLSNETTEIVSVFDSGTGAALSGAVVSLTGGGNTTKLTTGTGGIATFLNLSCVPSSYTLTASKAGYTTYTVLIDPTAGEIGYVEVPLSSSSVNPTATATTRPVTTAATIPIPTTGTGGTYTGFWAPFYNAFTAMGADAGTLNLLLAALIVLLMAFFGAVATGWSPWGFNSGAALGFIFCCAFGILQLWLIAAGICWLLLPLVLRRVSG
jgi:hypothetical protein